MGFYVTTENPNVMMRENHTTPSSEYIIIHENELYIVSFTPEEILHMLQDKYEINTKFKINIHMILVEKIFVNVISSNVWKSYMSMLICFSITNFLQIYIMFHSKLSVIDKKANFNLIHSQNTYEHFNYSSRKGKLENYIMKYNLQYF